MAHQGKITPADDQRRIQKLLREGRNKSETARIAEVSRPTVYKYGNVIGQTTRGVPFEELESDELNDD
jgi:DNA invertase Pin-like site-specific DNA recombinase